LDWTPDPLVQGRCFCQHSGQYFRVVLDPSGSAIVGAILTVTEPQTSVASQIATEAKEFYGFPELPIGKYDVEIAANLFARMLACSC